MTIDATRASGKALPEALTGKISRRLFLRSAGIGGAATLTAVSTVAADNSTRDETPELLALAPLYAEIEAECVRINENRLAARARCEAMIPRMPMEMIVDSHPRFFDWCTETARDCEDRPVFAPNGSLLRVIDSHALARQHPWVAIKPETGDSFDIAMHRLYKRTVRYERTVERAKVKSGLDQAVIEACDSYARASKYAQQVMGLEARTWIGVGIKARALDLAGRWRWDSHHVGGNLRQNFYAANLLPDVLRIAKGDFA